MKQKKKKEPLSYKEEHNRTLERFRKSSRLLIWVGALNVISLLVSIIQFVIDGETLYFYFCFGSNDLIFRSLMHVPDILNKFIALYFVIIVIIALATSAGAILLGVFASQGKKKPLFGSLIFYAIDTLLIIPCAFVGESYISILLMSVIHVAILFIIIFAVYEYYKIIEIAKRYGVLKQSIESEEKDNASI